MFYGSDGMTEETAGKALLDIMTQYTALENWALSKMELPLAERFKDAASAAAEARQELLGERAPATF